jgi:hypothetical protein
MERAIALAIGDVFEFEDLPLGVEPSGELVLWI